MAGRFPGYYNLADRGQWLDTQLADRGTKWNLDNSRALQLGNRTGYAPRLLAPLLPVLREVVDDAEGKRLVEQLAAWNGDYPVDSPPRCSTSCCSRLPRAPCTTNWAMPSSTA